MRWRPRFEGLDVLALVLAVALALTATFEGVREGNTIRDADEVVFQTTLREMRQGAGYYPAMRDALIKKERRPPTEVRAFRLPTEFLFLRVFPERAWRLLAGIAYLAVMLAAWRLGRPFGRYGGVLATVAVGVWVLAFSDFLYLHAEVWGLPLLLAALLALRRGDDGWAAGLLAAAVAVRELYGIAFVVAVLIRRFRRPWIVASIALLALALVHVHLAGQVLAHRGYEATLGNEHRTLRFMLRVISPGTGTANFGYGIAMLFLGPAGLAVAARRGDRAAWVALPFVVFMIPAAEVSTRIYWSAAWAIPAAAFAPAILSLADRRPPEPSGTPPRP